MVIVVSPDVIVAATAVNTPIGLKLVPVMMPPSTGVLTLLSISVRFCPGCASNKLLPEPVPSKKVSNSHRLLALAVKPVRVMSVKPEPVPVLLIGKTCNPPE
jgi:hypothetical protein